MRKPHALVVLLSTLVLSAGLEAAEPRIGVNGLDGEQTKNVRAFLGLASLKCDAPEWRLQSASENSHKEIAQALQALGYYDPRISGGALKRQGGCWSVDFQVEAGTPVRIAGVSVRVVGEGADDPRFQKLMAQPPIKTGDIVNHGEYENLKGALLSLAGRRGYFDARLTDNRLLIKPSSHQAWIHLSLDSGARYRFGKVSYQVDGISQELVERYRNFEEGDPFSANTLNEFQQALLSSNYFDNVVVHPDRNQAAKRVDLRAEFTGRKRHAYGIGLGLSTDKGPHANLNYENRYLNERGHRFQAQGEVSTIGGKLITSYAIPLEDPTKEWLTFFGQYEQEETDTSDRYTFTLGSRMTTALPDDWLQTIYLELLHENYTVGDIDDTAAPLVPGIKWERVKRKGRNQIHEGSQLRLELLGAPVDLANGSTFAQAKAFGYFITTPWEKGRLLARAELGATWAEDRDRLGVSHRFFTGGDRSVRGYQYESLGPKNDRGEVEGGTYLMVGSIEYEHMVKDDWALAAFVDTGNAYYDELDALHTGVGLGVRWFSPIGPIKVDLAHPLDDNEDDVRLHVGIGPEF